MSADKVDDTEVMRLWRECGLPEYFLGNGGTNRRLVAFAQACRANIPATQVYEAPRDLSIPVRVRGVFRDAGEPRSLGVALTERPTDDDIRSLHEFLRGWEP